MHIDTNYNIKHANHFEVWLVLDAVEHELLCSMVKDPDPRPRVTLAGPAKLSGVPLSRDCEYSLRQELKVEAKSWKEVDAIVSPIKRIIELEAAMETLRSSKSKDTSIRFLTISQAFNMTYASCTANVLDSEFDKFYTSLPSRVADLQMQLVPMIPTHSATFWDPQAPLPVEISRSLVLHHITFRLDLTNQKHTSWMKYWRQLTETAADYDVDRLTPEVRMKLWLTFARCLNKKSVDKLGGYWLPAILNNNRNPKFVEYEWEDKLIG